MFRYLFKRIIISIVVLFLVVTLLYFASWLAMIEQYSSSFRALDYFGIIFDRYTIYLKDIFLHFDFGYTELGDNVWDAFSSRVHYTLKITLASVVFFIIFGIALGIICGIKKGSKTDKIISYFTTAFSSLPSFILVWYFMLFFGWKWGLLPPIYPVGTEDPIQAILGLVIPVLSLSLWPLSKFIQLVRGEIIENIDAEYMLLARAKGLTKTQGVIRHMTRNTFVVLLPEVTNSFLFVLTSSFIVKIVYNIQGVANLFYDAMIKPMSDFNYVSIDIPTTILISAFYVSFGLIVSIIVDILSTFVDPRIRIGEGKRLDSTN